MRAALICPARYAWQVFLLVNIRSVKDWAISVRIMGFSVRKKAFLVRRIAILVVIVEVARSQKKGDPTVKAAKVVRIAPISPARSA